MFKKKTKELPETNFKITLTEFLELIRIAYKCNTEMLNEWLINFIKEKRKQQTSLKQDLSGILKFFEDLYSEQNRPAEFYEVSIPVNDRTNVWYILNNQYPLPKHSQCTICKSEFDLEVTDGKALCVAIGANKYCYHCWMSERNKFDLELRIKR